MNKLFSMLSYYNKEVRFFMFKASNINTMIGYSIIGKIHIGSVMVQAILFSQLDLEM